MDARLKYVKGSLFEAPKGVALLHACNTRGTWGSGIALQFKQKFPDSYKAYNRYCLNNPGCLGKSLVIEEKGYKIACLMTSRDYGTRVDSPPEILVATNKALLHLLQNNPDLKNIHSPKINAGLFKTPWNDTEEVIHSNIQKYNGVQWTVWEFE